MYLTTRPVYSTMKVPRRRDGASAGRSRADAAGAPSSRVTETSCLSASDRGGRTTPRPWSGTSRWDPSNHPRNICRPCFALPNVVTSKLAFVTAAADLHTQLDAVIEFLGRSPLAHTVADLEIALDGCGRDDVARVASDHDVTVELLRSAVAARDTFGKLNDLIHATAIALALPHLLKPGETLLRPSLAAGNTPERLFDVETDLRIAEFKFARWDGHDGGRQKPTVKDLARLAADSSGRRAELYLRGARPLKWLSGTTSSVRQQLKGYPAELAAFESAFATANITVADFVAGDASHVVLVDIEQRVPSLFAVADV